MCFFFICNTPDVDFHTHWVSTIKVLSCRVGLWPTRFSITPCQLWDYKNCYHAFSLRIGPDAFRPNRYAANTPPGLPELATAESAFYHVLQRLQSELSINIDAGVKRLNGAIHHTLPGSVATTRRERIYGAYAEMVLTLVGKWFNINSYRSSLFCALSISIPTRLPWAS